MLSPVSSLNALAYVDMRCHWLGTTRMVLAPLLFVLLATVLAAAPPAGYYLVWNDEFNAVSLDTSKWDNWLLGNRRDAVNTGAAISLNGSNLVLTTFTSNGTHYTG